MLSSVFYEGVTKLLPGVDAAEEVADPRSSRFFEDACSEAGTCPRLALIPEGKFQEKTDVKLSAP